MPSKPAKSREVTATRNVAEQLNLQLFEVGEPRDLAVQVNSPLFYVGE